MRRAVEFDELRLERHALNDVVATHHASVQDFKNPDHPWFRLQDAEEFTDEAIRHLSSTATCLESLHDVPTYFASADTTADERQKDWRAGRFAA